MMPSRSGDLDEHGHRLHAQLVHQVGAVGLDRADADVQALGDFLAREAAGQPAQHLALAVGERAAPRRGAVLAAQQLGHQRLN